jgi:serine/threonine protein kinase
MPVAPSTRAPASDEPRFAVGDRIGGRYRVVGFVASGAMGEVYAAEDNELGALVALKTLRIERADHPRTLARFRREVLLARELTHPGICRIFDLGLHEGERGRLLFLTMELLAGETLASRLRRIGRMRVSDALALAEKLVAALSVAHAAGVVHRDLKPANIVLVPDERGSGERVVITDFGLARRAHEAGAGARARALAAGSNSAREADADQTFDEEAAGVSPAADEGVTATGALLGSPAYMAPEQVTGRSIGPAADLYSLGVVLFEAVTGRLPFEGDSPLAVATMRLEGAAPRATSLRPSLDPRWDAALARCLAREPDDRFASAGELLRALSDGAASSVSASSELAAGVGGPSGSAAEVAPVAAVAASPGRWRWRPGAIAAALGTAAIAAALIARPTDPVDEGRADLAARPAPALSSTNPRAARELASGLAALAQYRSQEARTHLERAVALAADDPTCRVALARAWRALQVPARAREQAERAFALAAGLPRLERMAIEARHHQAAGRFGAAIDLLAALVAFVPDDVEHRIGLAEAQWDAGRARDVLITVDGARAAGGPAATDPRIDILEAFAARAVGDNVRARRAALAAREQAEARGIPALQAHAALAVCSATSAKDAEEARPACARAIELAEKVGDRGAVADATLLLANLRERDNATDEVRRLQDRALAIYRELGDPRGVGNALARRGNSLKAAGALDESLAVHREALASAREAGDELLVNKIQLSTAGVLVESGEIEAARASYLAVVEGARRLGFERSHAVALQNLAWVVNDAGQIIDARRYAEEAVAMQEKRDNKFDLFYALNCAGLLALEQDDLDAAEKLLVRAHALGKELGMHDGRSLKNLADVRAAQGRFGEARELVARAMAGTEPGSLDEGFVRQTEAEIALESGDLAGAVRALARARSLAEERSRTFLDIQEARLWTARGRPRGALALLGPALAESRRRGAVHERMMVEAAQAQAELAAGSPGGAEHLDAVKKEATARGYALLARALGEHRTAPRRSR